MSLHFVFALTHVRLLSRERPRELAFQTRLNEHCRNEEARATVPQSSPRAAARPQRIATQLAATFPKLGVGSRAQLVAQFSAQRWPS